MTEEQAKIGLQSLELEYGSERVRTAIDAVKNFSVEIPSWIFGPFGGGRFGEYMPPGAARSIDEKLDDAAVVHKLTGATQAIAMHVLWDFTEDGFVGSYNAAQKVADSAKERDLKIGSVSPTYCARVRSTSAPHARRSCPVWPSARVRSRAGAQSSCC